MIWYRLYHVLALRSAFLNCAPHRTDTDPLSFVTRHEHTAHTPRLTVDSEDLVCCLNAAFARRCHTVSLPAACRSALHVHMSLPISRTPTNLTT